MASDELKEIRKNLTKEAIRDHQMAKTGGTQTDLFTCGRCKKKKCTYTQVCSRVALAFETLNRFFAEQHAFAIDPADFFILLHNSENICLLTEKVEKTAVLNTRQCKTCNLRNKLFWTIRTQTHPIFVQMLSLAMSYTH